MDKLHLGKTLAEHFRWVDNKSDIQENDYRMSCYEYETIKTKYNNNGFSYIENYYLEAYKLDYFKPNPSQRYSDQLNNVLWGFLLFNEKSSKDIKILANAIAINFEKNNTISGIDKSSNVATYIKTEGYDTYLEFAEYLNSHYGIDANDYHDYILCECKHDEDHDVDIDTQKMLVSVLKENEKQIFDGDDIIDMKLLYKKYQEYVSPPIYKQNYKLPELKILKLKKVIFEFNTLDDKEQIINQISTFVEKQYKRLVSSKNKQKFLDLYFPKKKQERWESILAIKKAFLIYKYRQKCKSLEQARLIYNFHILLSDTKEGKFEYDDDYVYLEHKDLLKKSYVEKEIRTQINSITSILNIEDT